MISKYRKLAGFALVALIGIFVGVGHAAEGLTIHAQRASDLEGDGEGRHTWALKLVFNHPVFLSNLSSLAVITADGVGDDSSLITVLDSMNQADEAGRQFLIYSDRKYEKPAQVAVAIDKGLSDTTGKFILKRNFVHKFLTVETVAVNDFSTYYKNKKDKGIKLRLSRYVPPAELAKNVRFIPSVQNVQVSSEGRTLLISGDFELGTDYTLKIPETVFAKGGYILRPYEKTFKSPGLDKTAQIKTSRSVIELVGRQLLTLNLSNLPAFQCRLTKVPPALLSSLTGTLDKDSADRIVKRAQDLKNAGDGVDPRFFGPSNQESEAFFAPESRDKIVNYSVPLSFRKNPDQGGAWIVNIVDSGTPSSTVASKLVQITNVGLTYKISMNSLLVWATTLHDGAIIPGASIMLVADDGTLFFPGKTNQDGVLLLANGALVPTLRADESGRSQKKDQPISIERIQWIVAVTDSDSSGIKINSNDLKPAVVKRTQNVKEKPENRTGYIFTERGVYKPGETVFFKFVGRSYNDGVVSPSGESVKIEITNPRNDVVFAKDYTLSEFGSCFDNLETKRFFPTGTYNIKATLPKAAGQSDVFHQTFMVQDFKKIHHYVAMTMKSAKRPDPDYVGLKKEEEFLEIDVTGQYYTGGPVKNGQVKWKAMLVPAKNNIPGYDGYFFGNEDTETRFLESGDSILDQNGKLKFTMPLDPSLMTGSFGIQISATVIDFNGEPATEVQTYNPKPTVLIGMANHPTQVESGYSNPISLIVVDANGKTVTDGSIEATFMRKQYFYTTKRDESGNPKDSFEEGWVKSFSTQVPISGKQISVPVNLNEDGDYLVEFAYVADGIKYSSRALFQVGWAYKPSPFSTDQEIVNKAEVLLSLNKKEFKTGDTVRAQFTIPKPAKKCLVTLEKNSILDYKLIDGGIGTLAYSFEVKEDHRPNVYLSLSAPVGRTKYPIYSNQSDTDIPTIYFGYADIPVKNESLGLKLEIAPEISELKAKPAETKKLDFKVSDNTGKGVTAEMAICVVDEAILALTRYAVPDLSVLNKFDLPLGVFEGDLRLDLMSQDIFRMVTRPLTGGGMGLGEVSPSLRKDFRPVAYFNPSVITDASGKASVEFKLPDTTTAYRVYAVVCNKTSGFVSGQRNMVVTKEFFIEPALPRFSVLGDTFTFPLLLQNKTKEKGRAQLQAKAGPGVGISMLSPTADLDPLNSALVRATADIKERSQNAVFNFDGKFATETSVFADAVEMSIPVYSKLLPINVVKVGDFSEKGEIQFPLPAYLKNLAPELRNPTDFNARITFSRTNWGRLAPGLKYFMNYPYGCVEQTSSGIIPLAGLKELAKQGVIPGINTEDADKYLKSGVERLLSMQLQSGGFAYWPGQPDPSWWGTLYGVFALLQAKNAGISVPDQNLEKAYAYIKTNLFEGKGVPLEEKKWTEDLAVYILSEAKQMKANDLEPFLEDYKSLSNQSKALLLLAANSLNQMPKQRLTKMAAALDPKLEPSRSNYYDSTYREIAISLLAGLKLEVPKAKLDQWAGYLIQNLKPNGAWTSTADSGWCLLALSEYYKTKGIAKSKASTLRVEYGDVSREIVLKEDNFDLDLDANALLTNPKVIVTNNSKDLLHYTLSMTYPEELSLAGGKSDSINVSKKIENLSGNDDIRVGDVVRVTLTIDLGGDWSSKRYDYVVLEDPVPAGIVAINSELKTEGMTKTNSNSESEGEDSGSTYDPYSFAPSYLEMRDDKVRVFKDRIWAGTYKYSYLARATTEGNFWMRGTRLSLMYQPDVSAGIPGKSISILPGSK